MLFADFQPFSAQGFILFLLGVGFFCHMCKKFVAGNEEIKSAAREAATKKAVGFLQRFLK